MKRLVVGLLVSLGLGGPVWAQDDDLFDPDVLGGPDTNQGERPFNDPTQYRPPEGGGEDLFDPFEDMELERLPEQGSLPPTAEQDRMEQEIAQQVVEPAEAYAREIEELEELERTDPLAAEAAVEEALRRSERELVLDYERLLDENQDLIHTNANLQRQLETLGRRVNGEDVEEDNYDIGAPGTYGTPLSTSRPAAPAPSDAEAGEDQFAWWQRLLLDGLDGSSQGLQQLRENRANSLKARADALTLSTDPAYRSYVNDSIRHSVDRTSFVSSSSSSYDSRLDDLILGTQSRQEGGGDAGSDPLVSAADANQGGYHAAVRVERLPRERDPVTGEERIIVNMPLGVDPSRTIR